MQTTYICRRVSPKVEEKLGETIPDGFNSMLSIWHSLTYLKQREVDDKRSIVQRVEPAGQNSHYVFVRRMPTVKMQKKTTDGIKQLAGNLESGSICVQASRWSIISCHMSIWIHRLRVADMYLPGTKPRAVMMRFPMLTLNSRSHGVPFLPAKPICRRTTFWLRLIP